MASCQQSESEKIIFQGLTLNIKLPKLDIAWVLLHILKFPPSLTALKKNIVKMVYFLCFGKTFSAGNKYFQNIL